MSDDLQDKVEELVSEKSCAYGAMIIVVHWDEEGNECYKVRHSGSSYACVGAFNDYIKRRDAFFLGEEIASNMEVLEIDDDSDEDSHYK